MLRIPEAWSRRHERRRRPAWLTPGVYLGVLVFPVVTALLLVWFVELDHPAAEEPIQVVVTGDPGSPSHELYSGIQAFIDESSTAIALSTSDVQDPSRRVLYLGAPAGSVTEGWLSDGYPRLLFPSDTRVLPFAELSTESAAGRYLIYGSADDAQRFATLIRDHEYGAEVQDVSPMTMLFFKKSMLYGVVSCWILGATAVVASTFSRCKGYAIMRFLGNSAATVYMRELARVWGFLWPRLLAVGLPTLAALAIVDRWQGVVQAGRVALPIIAVMLGAILMVHGVALSLAYYLPETLPAMRGRVQHLPLMSLSYGIRMPVVVLLIVTFVSVAGGVSAVRDVQGVLKGLEPAGQAQRLAISELTARDAEEQTAIFLGVGDWLSDIDARGQAVVSQPILVESDRGLPPENVLLINTTYLGLHTVELADGSSLTGLTEASPEVIIGVPSTRMAESRHLEAVVADLLANNVRDDLAGKLTTRLVALADGQTLFTYGAQEFSAVSASVTMREPAVVLVPPSVLAPAFYSSIAGQGGYLFTDPAQAIAEATSDPLIAKYVRWIQPPAKPFLAQLRDAVGDLAAGLGALLFLLASLVATSFGVSVVYRTERAQQTMVRRLYGWSLLRTCRRALCWEAVLYTLVVYFFLMQIRNHMADAADPLLAERQASAAILQLVSVIVVVCVAAVSLVALLRRTCVLVEASRTS